jgi:hypothetical protein
MASVTPASAARQLLFQWTTAEAPLHIALQATDPEELRSGLRLAATFFHTIRNLKRTADEDAGVPRLELLRRCFAAVVPADTSEGQFVKTTVTLAAAIGRQYGGRSYLSLASKLLWSRYRNPFLIYDSVVRRALGTPGGNYPAYVVAWHARYREESPSISSACQSLARSRTALFRRLGLTPSDAARIIESAWFQSRVMDILLWQRGV